MQKKVILIIIAVIILALAGGFAYWYFGMQNKDVKSQDQIKDNYQESKFSSPKYGDVWEIGKTYDVVWDKNAFAGESVNIAIINNDDKKECLFDNPIPNTGTYAFKIPSQTGFGSCDGPILPGTKYQIVLVTKESSLRSPIFSVKSQDETADWKTYTNTEYRFEINYPNDWQTTTNGKEEWGDYSLFSFATDKELQNNSIGYVRITVEDSNFVLGTRDWKDFELGAIKGSNSCDSGGCEIIFFTTAKQNYLIQTKHNPNTDSLTHQILSTFKFTK